MVPTETFAMSFYDVGKPGLVETVCVVMTCDNHDELNTSQPNSHTQL